MDRGGDKLRRPGRLGVPEESLQSFPEAFRLGMAARAEELLDTVRTIRRTGKSPWHRRIHIGVSVFSDSEAKWHPAMETALQQYQGFPASPC